MTKLTLQRTEELNELIDYVSTSKRDTTDIQRRIDWLQLNLDTKQSKEDKQMAKEYKANKLTKTLIFNL